MSHNLNCIIDEEIKKIKIICLSSLIYNNILKITLTIKNRKNVSKTHRHANIKKK